MKLSKFTTALALTVGTLASFNAAASNIVFKPLNQNLETQACYQAATQGIDAAKRLVEENDVNFSIFKQAVTCNGDSLSDFADKYFVNEQTSEESEAVVMQKIVAIRTSNDSVESKLCLDAVLLGEEQARIKHDLQGVSVICNNLELRDFVRQFERDNVLVKLAD